VEGRQRDGWHDDDATAQASLAERRNQKSPQEGLTVTDSTTTLTKSNNKSNQNQIKNEN
jgi:hypothetical protein